MLMCDCIQCGGKNELAMCENGLLKAQITAHKAERNTHIVFGLLIVMVIISAGVLLH